MEELEFPSETVTNLQNKGVKTLSDLLTEEEKGLTEREQLSSLLNRVEETLSLWLFPPINIPEIQNIFSIKENYARYKGQEGYLLFVERSPNINFMEHVFRLVSRALGEDFKQLGWQVYRGSPKDFVEERGQVLDSKGRLKKKYRGMSGYARYAKEYHDGAMEKAFKKVSSVLGGYQSMKEIGLNWNKFRGSVSEYNNLLQLFEANKVMDFKGIEGQKKVAKEVFGGNKRRAYRNVSVFREILVGSKKPLQETMGWLLNLK
ncbi:MAG: hypothetical protein OXB86_03660 [Bdellovibrionales bacterium]|nr:hypothetical protein [Bdellovibrionales bacterium]